MIPGKVSPPPGIQGPPQYFSRDHYRAGLFKPIYNLPSDTVTGHFNSGMLTRISFSLSLSLFSLSLFSLSHSLSLTAPTFFVTVPYVSHFKFWCQMGSLF
eukprot:sb/3478690/